jgi:hypothetical protein
VWNDYIHMYEGILVGSYLIPSSPTNDSYNWDSFHIYTTLTGYGAAICGLNNWVSSDGGTNAFHVMQPSGSRDVGDYSGQSFTLGVGPFSYSTSWGSRSGRIQGTFSTEKARATGSWTYRGKTCPHDRNGASAAMTSGATYRWPRNAGRSYNFGLWLTYQASGGRSVQYTSRGRARFRCPSLFGLAGVVVAVAIAAACTNDDPPRSRVAAAEATVPTAPISDDSPLRQIDPVAPPTEPREPLVGPGLLLVDSTSYSVYEFDLGRLRFRGPSRRLDLKYEHEQTTLPGYPLVLGDETPQEITFVGTEAIVAGGREGAVFFLDTDKDLTVTGMLPLPVHEVVVDPATGERTTNANDRGRPDIFRVSGFGETDLLAVSQDHVPGTSVGYVVDGETHKLRLAAQLLPDGGEVSDIEPYRDTAVAAMSNDKLVILSDDLRPTREVGLPATPTHFTIVNDTAYVSVRGARLLEVDLVSGRTRELSAMVTENHNGPVLTGKRAGRRTVWWGLMNSEVIRRIDLDTGKAEDFPACGGVNSLVRYRDMVFFTCPGPRKLGLLEDGKKKPVLYPAGGFPFAIALPWSATWEHAEVSGTFTVPGDQ